MSGILSGRGINFVSSPSYKWHLTHQILATSVTRSVSDLIQSIRLFGRYNDDIPLTLYTPQNHINDLRKGIALHEQFIDGALNAEESEKMIEFYKKTPVFGDLIPKIKLSTKTKYQLNSVVRMVGEESGVYYLIHPKTSSERKVYDRVIEYLSQSPNTDASRGEVIGKIIDIGMEYNACEARLKDMCYKEDRNSRTTNKEELGLLIWKEGRYWKLRYNK
jgi:hypothetical protein